MIFMVGFFFAVQLQFPPTPDTTPSRCLLAFLERNRRRLKSLRAPEESTGPAGRGCHFFGNFPPS